MASKHLAIFLKGVAEKILSGEKQVEVRLSLHQVLPYREVQKDDEIFLKSSGGKILGKVIVDNVLYYNDLTAEMMINLRREYQQAVKLGETFWESKKKSKFATIIFLTKPQKFLMPIVYKKHDRRPWVVMER